MTKPLSIAEQLERGLNPSDLVNAATPAPAATSAPAIASAPASDNDTASVTQLLRLLMAKELREEQTLQAERQREENRAKQREKNAKGQDTKVLLKQARCKHLKGGKKGPKNQNKDYALFSHTFIDASSFVKCNICGMKWRPGDTVDYLVRNGKKISNHTHMGYNEVALLLSDSSTNTASSSEVPAAMMAKLTPQQIGTAVLQDLRIIDLDTGKPVVGGIEL